MEASSSFDLFLSYNTRDREPVLRVQAALRERGIAMFLDCQHLIVGLNWRDEIEVALTKVNSVAVFIGSEGFGRVQRGEKNLALDRQEFAAKEGRKFPVIPILLPGAKPDDVTGFLSQNTWIDLRTGLENAAAMDAIARAIKGEAPVPQVSPPEPLCPYRGLLAFTEDDAPLFYGRDAFADDLLCKARTLKLIAVVGPSGTGKSSVVQAGLLPRLRRERAPNATWEALIFRPGNRPFHNLADELVALYETSLSKTEQMLTANKLGEAFANNELPLDAPIAEALKATQWANRLLFIVDQFEELFTLTEEKDREPFVNLLLKAAETAPVTIVLTLRADFYSQSISVSRELSDLIQQGIVNIGYVKREELRRAIVKPAESVGLQFEDGLVDRILDNLEDEPGNLPLLEFALTELWEKRRGNRVTNQLYEDIGGVVGSLGKRAEDVFMSLSSAQQELTLRAFTRLVRVAAASEEGSDTRQRVNLQDFNDATQKVIQEFVKARLLVTNRNEATNEEIVEVAHEALIKNWDGLKDVLSKDREFLLWRQRLNFLLTEWQRVQKETGNGRDGLLYGHQLNEARRWSKSRHAELNEHESEFIRKSEEAAKRPKKRIAAAGVVLLLLMLAVLGWKVWDDRPASQINKIIADSKSLVSVANDEIKQDWFRVLVAAKRHNEAIRVAKNFEDVNLRASTLAKIAEILAQTGQSQEAVSVAGSIEDKDRRSDALVKVAQKLAQTNQLQAALTVATDIENDVFRSSALVTVVSNLAQANLIQEALEVSEKINIPGQHSMALDSIAQAFIQNGQLEQALAIARAIEIPPIRLKVAVLIVNALSKGNQFHNALSIARSIEYPPSRFAALIDIGQSLHQAGQAKTSSAIFKEALVVAGSIEPSTTRFAALIDIAQKLSQTGQLETSSPFFKEALNVAIAKASKDPRDHLLNLLGDARSFAQVGQVEATKQILKEASLVQRSDPDTFIYSHRISDIAQLLAQVGQAQEALSLARSIEDTRSRADSLSKIAQSLVAVGQIDMAKTIIREALDLGDSKLSQISGETISANFAQSLVKAGQLQEALVIAKDIEDPNALANIAQTLTQVGHYQEALVLAKGLKDASLRFNTLTTIAQMFAQSAQTKNAEEILDETIPLIPKFRDEQRSKAYLKVSQIRANLKSYRIARELANQCSNSDDRLSAYTTILREFSIDTEKISPEPLKKSGQQN